MTADVTVDVRDMTCAQALARVSRAMAGLTAGQVAAVQGTASDVRNDVQSWARSLRHAVVASDERDGEFCVWIQTSVSA